jgi:glycosyltransferase involved in cell wall biosynthesis
MQARVLHTLSQRPSLTGSGITLDALVREAAAAGWRQRAVIGVPAGDSSAVDGLGDEEVGRLEFKSDNGPAETALDFHVPGMSDVMPYPSTRFSQMTPGQLAAYRSAWRSVLSRMLGEFKPDIIHAHHAWILSSMLKDLARDTPVVVHGHGTALRQLVQCPHLADEIREGCGRNDLFVVLHEEHARLYREEFQLAEKQVTVVGAGYREDLFHCEGAAENRGSSILFAGKLSESKGLRALLDAFEILRENQPGVKLHIAGGGAGEETERLLERMKTFGEEVVYHGRVSQAELAGLMRECSVFVLPSFFEGLALVLIEALACGCRPVCTDLSGVRSGILPHLPGIIYTVPMPAMETVDKPVKDDLPGFSRNLSQILHHALLDPPPHSGEDLRELLFPFTWRSVYRRIETAWQRLAS